MAAVLRPYHPTDLAAIYRICLLTGAAGGDATALYRNPDLLPHLYAGPYPVADPGLTFVVADEAGVVGYVVGTADTAAFDAWLDAHWWPTLRNQYPRQQDPEDGTEDHVLVARIHDWTHTPDELLDRYPAHMHIDLLPRAQGQGWGRRLVGALGGALRERGVDGLHLGVDARNTSAIAFYDRVGFRRARTHDWGATLVLDL